MAQRAPYDADDNCRYAALHRARVGDWNIFRIYAALPAKDASFNRRRLDLPLQQGHGGDLRQSARCSDLGHARDLFC